MKTSTASFRLPDPARSRPAQWPAFAFSAAIIGTSLIALHPGVNDCWSQISYPVIARVDEKLLDYGLVIGPVPESNAVPTKPMIAVVFGCIGADDGIPEAEEFPPQAIAPKPLDPEPVSAPVIRPATYQTKRPREHSEAQELLN